MITASAGLCIRRFGSADVAFNSDGWLNASSIAARYGKKPHDWLRAAETQKYLKALKEHAEAGNDRFLKVIRNGDEAMAYGSRGTWISPVLSLRFARWLDPIFAVWAEGIISQLIRPACENMHALDAEIAQINVGSQAMPGGATTDELPLLGDVAALFRIPLPMLKQWMLSAGWTYQWRQRQFATFNAMHAGWLLNRGIAYSQKNNRRDRTRYQILVLPAGLVELSTAISSASTSSVSLRLPQPQRLTPAEASMRSTSGAKDVGPPPQQRDDSIPCGEAVATVVADALSRIARGRSRPAPPPKPQQPEDGVPD